MKRIGFLVLALVIALGVLGVGYSVWRETLTISATVNTGEVNAAIVAGLSYDDEPLDKDYSSISCTVLPADTKTLLVTITDGYPCINYFQEFDIQNTGTLPITVESVTISPGFLGTVDILNVQGQTINPAASMMGTLVVHIDEAALEKTTYTFTATIVVAQYNLAVPTP